MPDYEKMKWYDQVKDQTGKVIQEGTPLSAKNMNRMEEGIDLADNIVGALVGEAFNKIGAIAKELDKWQNQRIQQGAVTLYNKYVIEGCKLNKMPNSRYVELCKRDAFTKGEISTVYVDSKLVGINDEQTALMIPPNNSNSSKVFFIYIDFLDNRYRLNISEVEPVDKLIIYKVIVPSQDFRPDLNSVTLTDVRNVRGNSYFRDKEPFALVSLEGYPMLNSNYDVNVTIDGVTDLSSIGDITVYDKQSNGFKIKISGDADNVKLRWTLINSKVR